MLKVSQHSSLKVRARDIIEKLVLSERLSPAVTVTIYSVVFALRGLQKGEYSLVNSQRNAALYLQKRSALNVARRLLGLTTTFFPKQEELLCEYAQLSIEGGAYFDAERIIQAWKRRIQNSLLARASEVRLLHQRGELLRAEEDFDELIPYMREVLTTYQALWIARTATLLGRYKTARDILERSLEIFPKECALIRELAALLRNTGQYGEAAEFLQRHIQNIGSAKSSIESLQELHKLIIGELAVYQEDVRPEIQAPSTLSRASGEKVLMLLEASLPYRKSGYTYRSHALLKGLNKLQMPCEGYSAPGSAGKKRLSSASESVVSEMFDGVRYHRAFLPESSNYRHYPLNDFLQYSTQMAHHALHGERPRIIHAASNFKNGLVASALADAYQVPWVYELRGLWHETQCALGVIDEMSDRYRFFAAMEDECLQRAHAVVTLSERLKAYVLERTGRREDTIFIAPNGVHVSDFVIDSSARKLQRQRLFNDTSSELFVMGYIGSLNAYEGLDDAITAFAQLQSSVPTARFLIVGDGQERQRLEDLANNLISSSNRIIFTGRVPQSEVPEFMACLDLFVLPRKPSRVCALVPPIKPVESMAMGIPVLSSDLPVLTELIRDRRNGFTFEAGNQGSLLSSLKELAHSTELLQKVGKTAKEEVSSQRDWERIASVYNRVYDAAVSEFNNRSEQSQQNTLHNGSICR